MIYFGFHFLENPFFCFAFFFFFVFQLKSKVRIRTAQVDGELITKYLTTKQTRFGEHSILIETITNFIPSWPSISISQAIDDFLYTSITYSAQGW